MGLNTCAIATAFIIASIYTSLTCTSNNCQPFARYRSSLTPELKQKYAEVTAERQRLYLKGLIFGTIIGLIVLYSLKGNIDIFANTCIFATVAFGVQFSIYTLTPKSTYMLNHLETREQIDSWLEVYKTMRFRYHLGFIFGLIGYALLGCSFR
jgi:hypothetical protein